VGSAAHGQPPSGRSLAGRLRPMVSAGPSGCSSCAVAVAFASPFLPSSSRRIRACPAGSMVGRRIPDRRRSQQARIPGGRPDPGRVANSWRGSRCDPGGSSRALRFDAAPFGPAVPFGLLSRRPCVRSGPAVPLRLPSRFDVTLPALPGIPAVRQIRRRGACAPHESGCCPPIPPSLAGSGSRGHGCTMASRPGRDRDLSLGMHCGVRWAAL